MIESAPPSIICQNDGTNGVWSLSNPMARRMTTSAVRKSYVR